MRFSITRCPSSRPPIRSFPPSVTTRPRCSRPSAERCVMLRPSTLNPVPPYENPTLSPPIVTVGFGELRFDLQSSRPRRDRRSQDRVQPRSKRCCEAAVLDGSELPKTAQGPTAKGDEHP